MDDKQDQIEELKEIYDDVKKRVTEKDKPLKYFHYLHKHWDELTQEEKKDAAKLAESIGLTRDIPGG